MFGREGIEGEKSEFKMGRKGKGCWWSFVDGQMIIRSKSFDSPEPWGGEAALFHSPRGQQTMLFRDCELCVSLFLFLGHRRGDILQGRPNLSPPNLERSIEVGGGDIILLVLLNGRVLNRCILWLNLYIKVANAVAHNVQHLLVLRAFLVVLFHDAFEAIALLEEGLGAGAFLLGHLEELGNVDGGAE